MLFAGLIAALLLLWNLLPGSGGNAVGVYQDGALVKTIYLPHTGETETLEISGVAGGNTIEVSKDGVRVETPRRLTEKQRELLRQFDGDDNGKQYDQRKTFIDKVKELFDK